MQQWHKRMIFGVAVTLLVIGAIALLQYTTATMHEQVHAAQYSYLGYANTTMHVGLFSAYTQNFDNRSAEDNRLIYLASLNNEAVEYNNIAFQQMAIGFMALQSVFLGIIAYKAGRRKRLEPVKEVA